MSPDPDPVRPSPKRTARAPLLVLAGAFLVFWSVFVPNPASDALLSWGVSALAGRRVSFHQARARFNPRAGHVSLRAREIDLTRLCPDPSSACGAFVSRQGLKDGLVVRDTRWFLGRHDGAFCVHLLDAAFADGTLKGGLRFERAGLSKVSAALWLPEAAWSRFPELVGRRFSQDTRGRRLLKLTWSGGRWRLWGRSGPVLEASWR